MPIVLKSWSLNLLEPSGPVQACNEIALPFTLLATLQIAYFILGALLFPNNEFGTFKRNLVPLKLFPINPDF